MQKVGSQMNHKRLLIFFFTRNSPHLLKTQFVHSPQIFQDTTAMFRNSTKISSLKKYFSFFEASNKRNKLHIINRLQITKTTSINANNYIAFQILHEKNNNQLRESYKFKRSLYNPRRWLLKHRRQLQNRYIHITVIKTETYIIQLQIIENI